MIGISMGLLQMYNNNIRTKVYPESCKILDVKKECLHRDEKGSFLTYSGDGSKRYFYCSVCKKTIDNCYD